MAAILPAAVRRTRAAVRGRSAGLGLRRRLLLSFAVGSLLLCTAAAAAAWWLSASYLTSQRTRVATAEGVTSARAVEQGLTGGAGVPALLQRTRPPSGEALLHREGRWSSSARSLTPQDVPDGLREAALAGRAVRQRAEVDGDHRPVVAVPVTGGTYVAVLPLVELDATLRTLSAVLAGVALLTSAAFTVLGGWASRRALRPVERVSEAAAAVAAGDLHARLHTDDPDLRSLAETFNANAAALQARVERDARFAADVSHELRSPLTTLVNAVDVLAARRGELSPTAADMLDLVQAELVRFHDIVRDLLEISVEDAAATREPVRIDRLVRAAVGGRVGVTTEPEVQDAVVLGDPRRLERVVCNLVDNADTHGGGIVGVLVRAAGAGAVEVVVDDAGPGVPPQLRTEVFERFHRGPRARTTAGDGAGLGLALVAQHVRRHDGEVHVEDRPGGGARFVVRLPLEHP